VSHDDNEKEICVNCQLARVLTEWKDSGAPVQSVVEAITDIVNTIVYAALDDVFEDADEPVDRKAAH
jgi:hypothetical protein